jgi:hypothetical protein
MGFEGRVKYGPPGSRATTLLEEERESTENFEPERGDTTAKGSHNSPPVKTSRVSVIGYTVEITILNNTSDPALDAFKTAAATGDALAIRMEDYENGKGFDGDCTFGMSNPYPLNGEQVITFTGEPTREYRTPQLYVS